MTMDMRLGALLSAAMIMGCTTPVDDPPAADDGSDSTAAADTDPAGSGDDDTPPPATGDDTTPATGGSDADDGDTDPDPPGDSGDETTGEPVDEPGPDFREAGPHTVDTAGGSASLPDCSMSYDIFSPAGVDTPPAVILAHGFQGNRAQMRHWAEHWASWGVQVVTPDLCHATILDADHAQNGEDLRLLSVDLALGPVVYAGYSAGGLAAVVAASQDENTVALLGLDMVDNGGLGAGASASVDSPAFLLMGEPATCNENNNGLPVFAGAGGQSLRLADADHCDFQSPVDGICGFTCQGGDNGTIDDATIAAAIRGMSTAIVTWQTGLDASGVQWWTPGQHYYDELSAAGVVQLP